MLHRRLPLLALTAALALPLTGCVVHPHAAVGVRLGAPVTIARGHVHTARCGHFQYRGRWYHAAHHHHGPSCGHTLRGGVWILLR